MQSFPVPPRYLRTDEAALFLGLSPRTLEKHRTYGTGPLYRKLGSRVVYAHADLQRWADLGTVNSASDPESGILSPPAASDRSPRVGRDDGHGPLLPGRRMSEARANGRSEPHSPNRALSEKRPRGSTPPMYIRDPEVPLLRSFSSSRTRKEEIQSPVRQRYSETRTMTEPKFLTTKEVADRYRGAISIGTLKNWRSLRIGPSFVKLGKSILYPIEQLDRWDQENFVTCHAPKGGRTTGRERS